MRTIWLVLGVAAVAACGGNSGGGSSCPPFATTCAGGGGNTVVDAPGSNLAFHPFTPRTRSLALAGGSSGSEFQLSISDGTGAIACNLATDKANSLGSAGSEILADVTYAAGYPCPTGSYSIPSNCPEMNSNDFGGPSVPAHCAYYRAWDATGTSLGSVAATAGAITVTGNETSCSISVNLTFVGKTFTDTTTLVNGLASQPWCASN
jgi:hypothetical protein